MTCVIAHGQSCIITPLQDSYK